MNLVADRLSVTLDGKAIVREVSFSLSDGQWLMICGPNGAGKSTLVRAVSRSVRYTGQITLDGQDIHDIKGTAFARRVAVLSQQTSLPYAFSVEEVVALGRYAHRNGLMGTDAGEKQAVDEALEAVGLSRYRHRSVLTLSGGERQRTLLAQALCQQPNILVLDEPANHLDLNYQRQLFLLLDQWRRAPGHAVISVVHDLSLARRFGTHALLMRSGAGEFGAPQDVLTAEKLAQTWGMDVQGWIMDLARSW